MKLKNNIFILALVSVFLIGSYTYQQHQSDSQEPRVVYTECENDDCETPHMCGDAPESNMKCSMDGSSCEDDDCEADDDPVPVFEM